MAKAVLCPVCNGSGTLKVIPQYQTTANHNYETTCHGCNGKGWVEVTDDCVCPTPYNPYNPYNPWVPWNDGYWWGTNEYVGDDYTLWLTFSSSGDTDEED